MSLRFWTILALVTVADMLLFYHYASQHLPLQEVTVYQLPVNKL